MLTDASVLITGGLGRLGQAIAVAVEARGGVPVLTSRDPGKIALFNREAEEAGRRARARLLAADEEAQVGRFVEALMQDYPSVAGLVNNAYPALPYTDVEHTDWQQWMQAARIGLGWPLTLAAALVERQKRTRVLSIVNVASIYGVVAPDFAIYPPGRDPTPIYNGAIKAALIQQTRYLAVYWAERGVRINAVSPGGILDNQDPEFLRRYNATVPMRRMVTREEVASTVCFLLSQEAGGITGQNIAIDGGRAIR
ncbi:MAG: SDR family oxidoreductase [Gammaproteobacteria bacterium]